MTGPRRAFAHLAAPQQAGLLCCDPQFATYIVAVHEFPGDPAVFVRGWCDVASRRDLATDAAALQRFRALQTAFDAWAGRLPPQR